MLEKGQNWELFGYDVRYLGNYWMAAWRDLLWAHDSPVRQRLDEVVAVQGRDGARCYQAGDACAGPPTSDCRAVLLPADKVLSKPLHIPLQAERELDAILALEVKASSPFSAMDTRWGWRVIARDETCLRVVLVIASASATMAFLGHEFDTHDPHAREVWVDIDGCMVVINGFGEGLREQRYRKRLLHCAGLLAGIALLVLAMVAVAALFKGAQLERLESMSATIARDAAEASRFRDLLATANETITAANEVVALFPNPHRELARLTRLLEDDVYVTNFSMVGTELRLRGKAADAALVMQNLIDEPGYLEVLAPEPITRLNTGTEQFFLKIRVGTEAAE